jgi:hypothetical protein
LGEGFEAIEAGVLGDGVFVGEAVAEEWAGFGDGNDFELVGVEFGVGGVGFAAFACADDGDGDGVHVREGRLGI